jgi:ParB family chromosome partitioning protein
MANAINLSLPPVDELFTTQAERDDNKREKVLEIPISEIDDFPDHPFQVRVDAEMQTMADSIQKFGVLTPAVARQKEDGRYELVSGHRRKKACEIAGVANLPVIVRNMTRDEAIIFMVDSNLQREVILPSEKAMSYKMKLDAMKRQGQRTDLTSAPVAWKSKGKESAEIIGEITGDSKDTVRRYVRLTELIPEVLQMVDEGKMAFRPAVELSYLPTEQQSALLETMQNEESTPSLAQAIKMKQFSQDGNLNEGVILSILQEEKPNQVEQFKIPKDKISKFFTPGTPAQKIEDTIIKALKLYRQRERNRDAR